MRDAKEISTKVLHIVAVEFKIKDDAVSPKNRIVEDLGADSLRKVECLMKLEEVFHIQIPDQDARGLFTVGDMIAYLEQRLNK